MEGLPVEQEPPVEQEDNPGTYEYALGLFRNLKESGVSNVFNMEDPRVQEAWNAFDVWELQEDIKRSGIENLDRAKKLVRSALLLLEAGFDGKDARDYARERLDDLYAFALQEKNQEVILYIASELEKIAPKSDLDQMIEAKMAEVEKMSPVDAIGNITCMLLFNAAAKRMTQEQRQRLEDLRTRKRNEAGAPPPNKSWAK